MTAAAHRSAHGAAGVWAWVPAVLAGALPPLVAYNQPPSTTLINQCLAVTAWGAWLMVAAPAGPATRAWPVLGALGAVVVAAVVSMTAGALPSSLGLSAIGMMLAAMALAAAGAALAQGPAAVAAWRGVAWGLVLAGGLSALVALVQVFAPDWTDDRFIAHSGLAGRAIGNLRQPNHLCSLLLWALVAAVSLHELRAFGARTLWALAALLVLAVELSASRTGAVGLLLLPAWALLDRRLTRTARWVLATAPLVYLLAYGLMALYGHWSDQAIGAAARLAAESGQVASRNSRPNIWANTLAMVAQQPWTGTGFGEYNLAWTLTPFPGRPTAFFDHSHNLPLQLLVELGIPLALLVMALMAWGLLQALRGSWARPGAEGLAGRAALMVVLMIGLHSLSEYPLWYSYFLLPSAWAWGFALGTQGPQGPLAGTGPAPPPAPAAPPLLRWGAVAGLVMCLSGAAALWDYRSVVSIYSPSDGDAPSLAERIRAGQRSPLFAHHADYAAATNPMPEADAALGFARAVHNLLDLRLMTAWARHLAEQGDTDLARTVAARLREFDHPDAASFFEPCTSPQAVAFQCQPPQAAHAWRELVVSGR